MTLMSYALPSHSLELSATVLMIISSSSFSLLESAIASSLSVSNDKSSEYEVLLVASSVKALIPNGERIKGSCK